MAAKRKTAAKKQAATKRKGAKKRASMRRKKNAAATKPKAGTITRTYKGEEHKVTVAKDGSYRYEGESYRSLTAIAKVITGYASVSGPRFFGTDEASRKGGSK